MLAELLAMCLLLAEAGAALHNVSTAKNITPVLSLT